MENRNFDLEPPKKAKKAACTVRLRVTPELLTQLGALAEQLTARRQTRVSVPAVAMLAIKYGLELVEREAAGYQLPNAKRMTEPERLLAVAEEACKIGFDHLRTLAYGDHVSDLTNLE